MAHYVKCFEFVPGGYREIPFCQLVQNGKRNPVYADRFFVNWDGYLMEMTKEDYREFYKTKRRHRYVEGEAILHNEISYNAIDTPELCGEELIRDIYTSTEDDAIHAVMVGQLHMAMRQLAPAEAELIGALYFLRQSETSLAECLHVNQSTISRRKEKIRHKLKKLMKI